MLVWIAGSRRRVASGPVNIIADPGFDNAAAWTAGAGWSIAGSKANATNGATLKAKNVSIANGVQYRVRFSISNHVPSGARILLSLGNFQEQIVVLDSGVVRDGEYDFTVTANAQYGSEVIIDGQGFWNGKLHALSVEAV